MSVVKPASLRTVMPRIWPVYCAYLISQLGNWMFRASVLYEIYDKQNGSSSLLGLTIACIYVPILLGGKFLAPYADRLSSRRTLVGLDLLRALLLLPLVVLADLNQPGVVALALLTIVTLSLSSPLFSAAQSAYIRRTVQQDEIASAMAFITNLDWITYLLGMTVGSLVLLELSFRSVILIDILTFLVSLLILLRFMDTATDRPPPPAQAGGEAQQPAEAHAPFAYIFGAIFLLNLGAGIINLYPTVVARDIYHTGELGLSQLYLGNGIGGFLGALLVHQLRKHIQPIYLISVTSCLIALALAGMAVFAGMLFSVVASSAMLLFGQIFGVMAHVYLLSSQPVGQAGRVTGLFMTATFSGVAVNALLFSTLGTPTAQSFSALLLLCAASSMGAALVLLFYERLRRRALSEAV